MRKLKEIRFIILLLTIMFCSITIYAQHDHGSHGGIHSMEANQPPNGGEIKEAGKYKIEMVADMFLKKDQLRFYLFKGNFKTILNTDVIGTITIKDSNGNIAIQSLQAKGDDFFVAQLVNSDSFQASIKFIVKGKPVSAVFTHKGVGQQIASNYTCSMHPEVESSEPGKCPKCGMNLIKQ